MANIFDGRWQVFGPAGTDYAALFQTSANILSAVLAPDQLSFTVTFNDNTSIVYEGAGLSESAGVLSGTITKVTVRSAALNTLAILDSISGHQFLIDSGLNYEAGAGVFDQLLSGNNLIVGSTAGTSGNHELLDGGAGNDTFQPGNGHTTIDPNTGVSTLDLSGLTGPTTVNLAAQTFTVGGATGNMSGVTGVIGTDAVDTIIGGEDGEFTISGGDGGDIIDAIGQTSFGGQFAIDAGAGDDRVNFNSNGWGSLAGGDGTDTLRGEGELQYFNFKGFEVLDNTSNLSLGGFIRVRTDQLYDLDLITNSNGSNGGHIIFKIASNGTANFDRLLDDGLRATVHIEVAGTSVLGGPGDDTIVDFTTNTTNGLRDANFIEGGGGNDTIENQNGGNPLIFFSGNRADYTVSIKNIFQTFTVTDNRPGSPDGTDTILNSFNESIPFLVFADQIVSYGEAFNGLPASVAYNGVLQLSGPDNFDYEGMFPALDRAIPGQTSISSTQYVINYQGGIQIVFKGTGLSTSSEFVPNGGTVDEITVIDTSIPGSPTTLARFYSEPDFEGIANHEMKVPFSPDILTGGTRVYHQLMFGNNHIDGSPNDDRIPSDIGHNTFAMGEGFDTLYLTRRVDSYSVELGQGGITLVEFADNFSDSHAMYTPPDPFKLHPAPYVLEYLAGAPDHYVRYGGPPPITDPIIKFLIALAGGDPHIVTNDGVSYSFQALGEFVLAKSTVPGDNLEIQMRTVPFPVSGMASVIDQTAARVGADLVTVDATRAIPVAVNGVPVDLSLGPMTLDGGTITEVAPNNWRIDFETGETFNIYKIVTSQNFLTLTFEVTSERAPGTLVGLWGNFDGDRANDFQLEDGTVLTRPVSRDVIYSDLGDSWRVSQAGSLFDYDIGETTETFTDHSEPVNFTLTDLPNSVLLAAEAVVNEAGILDQGLREFATYDYILTGDASFVRTFAQLDAIGVGTREPERDDAAPALTRLGVIATTATVIENTSGNPTAVTFEVYRSGPPVGSVVVDWQAIDPGAGYFDFDDYVGDVLPSGQVTLAHGVSSAQFTVQLEDGAVVSAAELVRVEISNASSVPLLAPHAQAEVVNRGAASGDTALPQFLKLAGGGTLTRVGNAWTLDLGTLPENTSLADIRLAITNAVGSAGNELSGIFSQSGSFAAIDGASTFLKLGPGGLKGGITVTGIVSDKPGSFQSTLTMLAFESNDTGYSADISDITLTIKATLTDVPDTILGTPGDDPGLIGEEGVDFIFGLAGNDTLSGLGFADTMNGGTGVDAMFGGDGNDTFIVDGTDGEFDTFSGGAGTDVFQAGTGPITLAGFNAAGSSIEAWAGNGQGLLGNGGNNSFDLSGLASVSGLAFIDGGAGDDAIVGSSIGDLIRGGLGKDTMTGGLGGDRFDFDAVAEIGKKKGLLDLIADWGDGDTIDLSSIDANGKQKGDKAFKFLKKEGADFTKKPGQLAFDQKKGVTVVEGDIDGNGKADFRLELTGPVALDKGDFLL